MQLDSKAEQRERLYDSQEAADYFGVGKRTLQKWVSPHGQLRCVKIGGILKFRLEDLRQFAADNVR